MHSVFGWIANSAKCGSYCFVIQGKSIPVNIYAKAWYWKEVWPNSSTWKSALWSSYFATFRWMQQCMQKLGIGKGCSLTQAPENWHFGPVLMPLSDGCSSRNLKGETGSLFDHWVKVRSYQIVLHCGADQLLSAASHRSITAFQVKMNWTFMQQRSAVTLQFLCRTVQGGNARQLQRCMNGL